MPKRPGDKRVCRVQKCDEEGPKGREDSETRAWARVSVAGNWEKKQREGCKHTQPTPIFSVSPHISIPKIVLNRNPKASDNTKNSQIQFHSIQANLIVRSGYLTSMD